ARGSRSGDEAAPDADRDGLRAVARAELAEQALRVGLDRVLGQEQVLADLVVRAPVAHPDEHLVLALRELDLAVATRGRGRGAQPRRVRGGEGRGGHDGSGEDVRGDGREVRGRRPGREVTARPERDGPVEGDLVTL